MNGAFAPTLIPFRFNVSQYADLEYCWPQRLLHIESLTSYAKGDDNTYGGVKEPAYNVLSYTWGRFQDPNADMSKAIPIKGVSWPIPVIREDHFTAETFKKVLNQMRGFGVDFVWVDIACIDQQNEAVKMEEVGRQAGIFKNAQSAYIWLSHISTQSCYKALAVIHEVRSPIMSENTSSEQRKLLLRALERACGIMSQDPWFESLWTLQELIIRNDAMILSSTGDLVMDHKLIDFEEGKDPFTSVPSKPLDGQPVTLSKVASEWNSLEISISQYLEQEKPEILVSDDDQDKMRNIVAWIKTTGVLETLSNIPNVQYGAAHYRKTTYPEDRVYAIMQIYNIRVGQAARAHERPSLEQLVDEFGRAINSRSPMMGQSFVHTDTPMAGRTWCITDNSSVPDDLRHSSDVRLASSVDVSVPDAVKIMGSACSLAEFLHIYNKDRSPWERPLSHRLLIHLDMPFAKALGSLNPSHAWDYGEIQQSSMKHSSELEIAKKAKQRQLQGLLTLGSAEDILLLRLGSTFNEVNAFGLGGMVDGRFYRTEVVQPRKHMALILRRVRSTDRDGTKTFERLGVCTWLINAPAKQSNVFREQVSAGITQKLREMVYPDGIQSFSEEMENLFNRSVEQVAVR